MNPFIVSFFGTAGNVLSFMQYVSPVPTFYRIIKNKSTEQFECLPYICTVLNSALWTYYGLTKPDYFVCAVNAFGAFIEAIYVAIFLLYASPKKRVKTVVIAGTLDVGVLGVAVLVTYLALEGPMRTQVIGILCLAPMVAMYASPLAALENVILTKSVEYMPFGLSFIMFVTGATWTTYALLVHDHFLGVPNGIGFLFGAIQLAVYYIFKDSKKSYNSSSDQLIEEGSQKEPLLPLENQSETN